MGKKLIFLADVHLCPENQERAERLAAFLHAQRAEAEAIYILGDLFDYWVGPRQARRAGWGRLLERLGEAAKGGPPIRVLGGNRDYLLNNASVRPYGLESLGLEHRFERDGLRFFLIHGHMQFPDSRLSKFFLRRIQGPAMRWLARVVPLWVALFVAGTLRRWRRLVVGRKDPKRAKRYDPAAFLPFFEAGADVVVCGHNHWANDYSAELAELLPRGLARRSLGEGGCRLFAVGPWDPGPSHLEYANGSFRLVGPRLGPQPISST